MQHECSTTPAKTGTLDSKLSILHRQPSLCHKLCPDSPVTRCYIQAFWLTNWIQSQEGKIYKKAVLSQRWPRNALYIWVAWTFSGLPWLRPRSLFPTIPWAFVPIDPMNVPTKFEVRSFTRSWDNRGYQKNFAVPGYAHDPFSPKFLMGFYSARPCKYTRQIWSP